MADTLISNRSLVSFLSNKSKNESFTQRLKIGYRPLICPFVELLEEANKLESVFDIGCGAGQFALLLAEYTKVKKIGGIEIKEALITEANHLLAPYKDKKEIRFQTFDGAVLPEEIKNYDGIFLIDVLHHVPVPFQESFIKNIFDKMRPGAVFVLKDIDASNPLVYMNKLHDLVFAGEIGHEYKFETVGALLRKAGFTVLSTSKKRMWWYPHYTYIVKKA